MRLPLAAAAGLLLVGCASPADVEATHRAAVESYEADLAFAQEWNVHTFGIPASGWVAIFIVGAILVSALAFAGGVWAYRALDRRATHRQQLAAKRLDLQIAREKRGRCTVCGADPLTDNPAREA